MIVEDQKANNLYPATITASTWTTRELNTVVINDITGASLASNQITLAA